jgi:toxin ParE1/3/4
VTLRMYLLNWTRRISKGFRVVVLASAEQDLKELRAYIFKNFSADTWRNTYAKIKEAVRNLQNFPEAGCIPEEIEKLNLTQYRQVSSGMNRVIYELRQDVIYIHIIVDTRRDMNTLLTRRLLRVT